MYSSGKQVSATWSFVAGTLLGALAVLVLLGSLGIPGLKAGGAEPHPSVAVEAVASAGVPETMSSPKAYESDFARPSVSTTFKRRNSNGSSTRHEPPRHWELDLQLD